MSLITGGLKSILQSASSTVAQLAGTDIVARSFRATQVAGSSAVAMIAQATLQLANDVGVGQAQIATNAAGNAINFTCAGQVFTLNGSSATFFAPSNGGFALQTNGSFSLGGGTGSFKISNVWASVVAPAVVAGAGASVTNNNGTGAFSVNLGGAASTGTITLPTATNGWVLYMQNVTHPDANVMGQTGFTQTTATFTNYVRTTGVAGNWTANDVAVCIALGF